MDIIPDDNGFEISNERLYFVPSSNRQILFEKMLLEKEIYFLKQDTYSRRPLLAYSFYDKDIEIVNDICGLIDNQINKSESKKKKRPIDSSKSKIKIIAIILIILIVLLVLISLINS
jgi:hypothetical protein